MPEKWLGYASGPPKVASEMARVAIYRLFVYRQRQLSCGEELKHIPGRKAEEKLEHGFSKRKMKKKLEDI